MKCDVLNSQEDQIVTECHCRRNKLLHGHEPISAGNPRCHFEINLSSAVDNFKSYVPLAPNRSSATVASAGSWCATFLVLTSVVR
jgi:hypothetical protein